MATSADLAAQIRQYDSNKVTSTDALNEALAQYGVPEIRKTVGGLRTTITNTTNALNNVDPSVTGRTQGSLVTEAQRQKQVANERAPIAGQLTSQGQTLGDQERILQDSLGQATTQASNKVNDYVRGRTTLQSQYDDAFKSEQAAMEAEARRQALLEQQRQFNESLRASSRAAGSGGYNLGGGGASGQPASATATASKADSPEAKGYDFVRNMKDSGAPASAIVSDFNAAKNWYEKMGNPTDYYKLIYYRQLFPDILKNARVNQVKGLRF